MIDLIKALRRRLVRGETDPTKLAALRLATTEAVRRQWPAAPRKPDARAAADLVAAVMAALPEPAVWPEDIERIWPSAVGAGLAAHSRPLGLARGILVAQVDHPGVRFELQQRGLERLRRHLEDALNLQPGTIRKVRLDLV